MSDKPHLNRRRFVQLGASVCAGAAATSLIGGCAKVGVVQAEVDVDTNAIPIDKSEFNELAGDREAIFVEVFELDAPIILAKNGDGFVALSAKCTHQACIVRPEKTQIACSCHGSRYSRDGKVTNGPAARELPQYVVKVDDEKIRIEIP